MESQKAALGPNHPDVARTLNNMSVLASDLGRYEEAEQLARQALAIDERALGPEHPDVASSLTNIAGAVMMQHKPIDVDPVYLPP